MKIRLIPVTNTFSKMEHAEAWLKKCTEIRRHGSKVFIQKKLGFNEFVIWRTITDYDLDENLLTFENRGGGIYHCSIEQHYRKQIICLEDLKKRSALLTEA